MRCNPSLRWSMGLLAFCCILAGRSQAAEALPPDPAEIPIRSFLAGRIAASFFAFAGNRFPLLAFDPASAAKQFLGNHRITTSFYDIRGNLVAAPVAPGP